MLSNSRPSSDYYNQLTYLSSNPFVSARLKLKRANRHILEVANTAQQLPGRRNYHFVCGPHHETGKAQIVFMTKSLMPMEFAGAVGDAVHNLRSAFDHMAVALTAPPLGTGKASSAYFPTGVDQDEFIKSRDGAFDAKGKLTRGKMKGAPSEALLLVEELEPYTSGKNSLRALHDLDVLDKHKLIVPAVSRMTVQRLDVTIGDERMSLGVTDFEANEDGTNLVALIDREIATGDELKLDGNFEPTFEIVFAKGQPLGGEPIIPALSNIADTCRRFIEACELEFLAKSR